MVASFALLRFASLHTVLNPNFDGLPDVSIKEPAWLGGYSGLWEISVQPLPRFACCAVVMVWREVQEVHSTRLTVFVVYSSFYSQIGAKRRGFRAGKDFSKDCVPCEPPLHRKSGGVRTKCMAKKGLVRGVGVMYA